MAFVLIAALVRISGMRANQPVCRPGGHAVVGVGSSAAFDLECGPDDSVLTIQKRVDEVNVLFIATDRHGKFVRNLDQNDFSIFDDHKPVESILTSAARLTCRSNWAC